MGVQGLPDGRPPSRPAVRVGFHWVGRTRAASVHKSGFLPSCGVGSREGVGGRSAPARSSRLRVCGKVDADVRTDRPQLVAAARGLSSPQAPTAEATHDVDGEQSTWRRLMTRTSRTRRVRRRTTQSEPTPTPPRTPHTHARRLLCRRGAPRPTSLATTLAETASFFCRRVSHRLWLAAVLSVLSHTVASTESAA